MPSVIFVFFRNGFYQQKNLRFLRKYCLQKRRYWVDISTSFDKQLNFTRRSIGSVDGKHIIRIIKPTAETYSLYYIYILIYKYFTYFLTYILYTFVVLG